MGDEGLRCLEFNALAHRSHPKCCLESMETLFETGVLKLDDLVKKSSNELSLIILISDGFFLFAHNQCQNKV